MNEKNGLLYNLQSTVHKCQQAFERRPLFKEVPTVTSVLDSNFGSWLSGSEVLANLPSKKLK